MKKSEVTQNDDKQASAECVLTILFAADKEVVTTYFHLPDLVKAFELVSIISDAYNNNYSVVGFRIGDNEYNFFRDKIIGYVISTPDLQAKFSKIKP